MKPRKHWGFRIAIGLIIAIAILVFLGGVLSLVLSVQYGFEEEAEQSLYLMLGSGFAGLLAYLLVSSLYRWWQKNDLALRRAEQQRTSRIKSLRDKQS